MMTIEGFSPTASLYLYPGAPLVVGSLSECAVYWNTNLSSFGKTLARIRVQDTSGAYWLVAEDIRDIAKPQSSPQ